MSHEIHKHAVLQIHTEARTLSSDGRYVFAIEDLGLDVDSCNIVWGEGGQQQQEEYCGKRRPFCNRLAAYDLVTGKLEWYMGAAPEHVDLWETFFLGPPLPLMGHLYVLAKTKEEIQLIVLEAATGDLVWSQSLALLKGGGEDDDRRVSEDPLVRWAGISPSFADGVLVCPTNAGTIVGVDLAKRSLLWKYRFDLDSDADGKSRRAFGDSAELPVRVAFPGGPAMGRCIDSSVCIIGGRALATSARSDFLHCLSLLDGQLLWKCPRQDDLYVACADREQVVLVGRRVVRAVRWADGKPAWDGRSIALPGRSTPSGRGCRSSRQYYFFPLDDAEVVGIDLDAGKIAHVFNSCQGKVPGNLICHKGKVLSLGLEGMDAYNQLEPTTGRSLRESLSEGLRADLAAARSELLARLTDAGRLSDAELAVWRGAPSAEPAARATAVAKAAELFGRAGRAGDAALCYRWLGRQCADVTGLDGRIGTQRLEAHSPDEALHCVLDRDTAWPTGSVEVTIRPAKGPHAISSAGIVALSGDPGPFLSDLSIRFDQRESMTVVGCDPWGRERWQVALAEEGHPPVVPSASRSPPARIPHCHVGGSGTKTVLSDGWLRGLRPSAVDRPAHEHHGDRHSRLGIERHAAAAVDARYDSRRRPAGTGLAALRPGQRSPAIAASAYRI